MEDGGPIPGSCKNHALSSPITYPVQALFFLTEIIVGNGKHQTEFCTIQRCLNTSRDLNNGRVIKVEHNEINYSTVFFDCLRCSIVLQITILFEQLLNANSGSWRYIRSAFEDT